MELLPKLEFGLWNGWILLALYNAVYGILLLIFKRPVVARLYDRSKWSRKERRLSASGKLFILAWLVLAIFTPLNTQHAVFTLGLILWFFGLVGFIVALLNFNATPLDQPVTRGLYRISRNPQQVSIFIAYVGISLTMGSWLALLLISIGIAWGHVRVLAEEETCLASYGDSYREYMERVPRYILFF
jgi:protein-S-isoprenylcysteine O-methyltransferase Ste14